MCGSSSKANILINKDRRACLADFGLSTITGVATRAAAGVSQVSLIPNGPLMSFAPGASRTSLISNDTLMSFTAGGTRRWMSPELLDPELFGIPESEGDRPTRQSDCYALGMVIYEVRVCGVNSSSRIVNK
jgi:serine/threonine protein kinase